METELALEFDRWHPSRCACALCEAEITEAGNSPVQCIPDWFLEQSHPDMLAHFKSLRDL